MPSKTTRKREDAKQPPSKAEIAKTEELSEIDLDAVVGGLSSSQLGNASALSRAGASSSGSESGAS